MPFTINHPERALASAILYQAVHDWKRTVNKPQPPDESLDKLPELLNFFGSDWCQELCDLVPIDRDVALKAIGITIIPTII